MTSSILICYNIPMMNKTTKNLIILGTILFSLNFANSAFASSSFYTNSSNSDNLDNNQNYYQDSYRNNNYDYNYNSNHNSNYRDYNYDSNYNPRRQNTQTETPIINNYYYPTPTTTKTSTSTSTSSSSFIEKTPVATSTVATTTPAPAPAPTPVVANTLDQNGDGINDNLLGASAANGLTALSLNGSGGFMPSSIWQWILVAFLILIIIVLIRTVTNSRPRVSEHHDSIVLSH